MKLINQKCEHSCAIASTAMLSGKTFEEVYSVFLALSNRKSLNDYIVGVTDFEILGILKKLGLPSIVLKKRPSMCRGLLSVPSLNNRLGSHSIFIDEDDKIYDPQSERPNKRFYNEDHIQKHGFPSIYYFIGMISDESVVDVAEMEILELKARLGKFDKAL